MDEQRPRRAHLRDLLQRFGSESDDAVRRNLALEACHVVVALQLTVKSPRWTKRGAKAAKLVALATNAASSAHAEGKTAAMLACLEMIRNDLVAPPAARAAAPTSSDQDLPFMQDMFAREAEMLRDLPIDLPLDFSEVPIELPLYLPSEDAALLEAIRRHMGAITQNDALRAVLRSHARAEGITVAGNAAKKGKR